MSLCEKYEGDTKVDKTWKPTAAGIICIIVGAICLIPGILCALYFAFGEATVAVFIGAFLIILGVIPIVGGTLALRRRVWGLALAGSIVALIVPVLVILAMRLLSANLSESSSPMPTIPEALAANWYLIVGFGIASVLAIIFVVKGKREFR
jgi:uncharacterized membrane protein HdeD (DUF308 family)